MQKYGQDTPPEISLTNIDLPIAMFVGEKDPLGDPKDTRWVHSQLKNVVYYKEYAGFDHSSFQIANDMSHMTNVVELMRTHTKWNLKPKQSNST